jgi:hypothetical protein
MTLNEIVVRYVAFRKSMGDDFSSAESVLKTFCRRVGEDVELADITADHVQGISRWKRHCKWLLASQV